MAMHTVINLRLIRKLVVDFLRVTTDWKSAFFKGAGQFRPNFDVVEDIPREPFIHR